MLRCASPDVYDTFDYRVWLIGKDILVKLGYVVIEKHTCTEIRDPTNNHLYAIWFNQCAREVRGGWIMRHSVAGHDDELKKHFKREA